MNEADASLVARIRSGEEDAFRELVQRYEDRILAVVSRIAGRAADPEDLAQETFIKAFGAIHRFEGNSALYTWLYRIAVNTARDGVAARLRRPAVSLDALPPSSVDPVDGSDGPLDHLHRDELRARVRQGIERLPEPFRTTLVLREVEGHTYEEVASILGVSIGTVESRLFRARGKLRAILLDGDRSP
ncbi:MAG: sigma-70 family RNA polymerase sigma factor [Planctomycetes bacterium]|nr:sigma-70 family RNA polymerase sigma factor [Planctomycetota bacterium]